MANKTDQGNLQRGKACLRCRKRKMRCDGAKPACQQCTRAKKGDCCEYDDGKGKTRTQLLRETIARLERRVQELEDPEQTATGISLFDPNYFHHSESSSSSLGSPGSSTLEASHSPFPDSRHSPHGSWSLPSTASSSPPPISFSTELFNFEESIPFPQNSLYELEPFLLDIFAPHQQQCGLDLNLNALKEGQMMSSEQRHPALMNAIYLWACFVSRPKTLSQHEDQYLNQALEAHREGLRRGDNIVDVIRASCLLSLYFLANGRLLEGSYHSSAAAALAVQNGFHSDVSVSLDLGTWSTDSFDAKPARPDSIEGERILTFWQVYNLDQCWSVALRKPSSIPDNLLPWTTIDCPWPQTLNEYQSGHFNVGGSTVKSFLEGEVTSGGFCPSALRAKASALYARADHLAAGWDSRLPPSDQLQAQVQALEHTILLFISTLVPVQQLESTLYEDKRVLIVTHTLAHAALIQLHQRFSQRDPTAYDKCSRAASACVEIVKHINDADYRCLDLIVGPCWTSASDILIRDLDTYESSWPLLNSDSVKAEIATLLYALNNFNSKFPFLGSSVTKVQKRLSEST